MLCDDLCLLCAICGDVLREAMMNPGASCVLCDELLGTFSLVTLLLQNNGLGGVVGELKISAADIQGADSAVTLIVSVLCCAVLCCAVLCCDVM